MYTNLLFSLGYFGDEEENDDDSMEMLARAQQHPKNEAKDEAAVAVKAADVLSS